MALVKCPSCGERISSMAKVCSHCKASISANNESLQVISHIKRSNQLMNQSFLALTLFIGGVVTWFWGRTCRGDPFYYCCVCFYTGFRWLLSYPNANRAT